MGHRSFWSTCGRRGRGQVLANGSGMAVMHGETGSDWDERTYGIRKPRKRLRKRKNCIEIVSESPMVYPAPSRTVGAG